MVFKFHAMLLQCQPTTSKARRPRYFPAIFVCPFPFLPVMSPVSETNSARSPHLVCCGGLDTPTSFLLNTWNGNTRKLDLVMVGHLLVADLPLAPFRLHSAKSVTIRIMCVKFVWSILHIVVQSSTGTHPTLTPHLFNDAFHSWCTTT